jgi:integrase
MYTGGAARMKTFESVLTPQIELFLRQKRALGFSYKSEEGLLRSLERYCATQHPSAITITRDIADGWIIFMNSTIGDTAVSESRVTVIREFARFLLRSGIDAYVIPSQYYTNRRVRYTPHIFTDSELQRFFSAVDSIAASRQNAHRHLVVSVIFRLLFCCGLRPNEVLSIQQTDIDWDNGAIVIRESKGHKDRRVVVDDEMLALCKHYYAKIKIFFPENDFLFPSSNAGGHIQTDWLGKRLNMCLRIAGLTEFVGNKPRVYDFRHTFATNTLRRWLREGREVNACLPYLSAFMGHEKFEDTQYYIHLVPEFFAKSSGVDFEKYADLLPEVCNEIS